LPKAVLSALVAALREVDIRVGPGRFAEKMSFQ
jgi:hypothetical protein